MEAIQRHLKHFPWFSDVLPNEQPLSPTPRPRFLCHHRSPDTLLHPAGCFSSFKISISVLERPLLTDLNRSSSGDSGHDRKRHHNKPSGLPSG